MKANPSIVDRLTVVCGPPDRIGKSKVSALFDGKPIHHGHFVPYSEPDRQRFAESVSIKMAKHSEWVNHWWNPSDDSADVPFIGEKVTAAADAQAEQSDDVVTPKLRTLADVEPDEVRWLWPQRMALGKLTLLAGDPGLGKSFLTLDIAARLSTGAAWADSPHDRRTPGGVVILSAEDGLEDTIRPRLDAAGADTTRIAALTGVEYRTAGESPQDVGVDLTRHLPALEQAIRGTPDCSLVIVDPITAYMGDTDSHKNAEVRAMLARLSELAARCDVAILAVTHLNKASTQAAIYRAMGSLGFVAAARAVWVVVKDKDDPKGRRRLLLPVKNNLGNDESGLAYRLSARHVGGNVPVVEWEPEPVSNRADEALSFDGRRHGPKPEGRNEAVEFLRSALANGPRPGKEVIEEAREAHGISKRTLERAKSELNVECYQDQKPGPWYWKLRHPQYAKPSDSKQLGDLGDLAKTPAISIGFDPQESPGRQVSEVGNLDAVNGELSAAGDGEWEP